MRDDFDDDREIDAVGYYRGYSESSGCTAVANAAAAVCVMGAIVFAFLIGISS